MNKELIEAINDAIFMFKDIEKARQLPPYAEVQHQYIALGHRLEKLMKEEMDHATE